MTTIKRIITREIPSQLVTLKTKGKTQQIPNQYELRYEPVLNSEHVYADGILQEPQIDYILLGKTLQLLFILLPNSRIRVSYIRK